MSISIDTVLPGLQSMPYAAGEVRVPGHMIVSHSKPIVAKPFMFLPLASV